MKGSDNIVIFTNYFKRGYKCLVKYIRYILSTFTMTTKLQITATLLIFLAIYITKSKPVSRLYQIQNDTHYSTFFKGKHVYIYTRLCKIFIRF